MQFVALTQDPGNHLTVQLEQVGDDVLIRLDGLVICHLEGRRNVAMVYPASIKSKGVEVDITAS